MRALNQPLSQQPLGQQPTEPWHGRCDLHLLQRRGVTIHQGGCSAPLKLMRAERGADGRCQLPLLHTAGGLVGGDALTIQLEADRGSRGLVTSVAAQKVYGSVGRSRLHPAGAWARQTCRFKLAPGSDLEWLPQELVLFDGGLYEQTMQVELAPGASYLGAELVRLGRTAAGETLGAGCWRSNLEIHRSDGSDSLWELVDRLELGGDALKTAHGMHQQPVFRITGLGCTGTIRRQQARCLAGAGPGGPQRPDGNDGLRCARSGPDRPIHRPIQPGRPALVQSGVVADPPGAHAVGAAMAPGVATAGRPTAGLEPLSDCRTKR